MDISPSPRTTDEDPARQLRCQAVVLRMGDTFGEFGVEVDPAASPAALTRWHLRVTSFLHPACAPARAQPAEDAGADPQHDARPDTGSDTGEEAAFHALLAGMAREPVFDSELGLRRPRQVVKLRPGHYYAAEVRVYDDARGVWGAWSAARHAASRQAVRTVIDAVGMDYVRLHWDRPPAPPIPRGEAGETADKGATAFESCPDCLGGTFPEAGGQIDHFELKVLTAQDMAERFVQGFENGVRTHRVGGLRPGTAYIVMVRYSTLIGTLMAWAEIGRFFTEPALALCLRARGEDRLQVAWERQPLPVTELVGYTLPTPSVLSYEVSVDGGGEFLPPRTFPPTQTTCEVDGLQAGTRYAVRVRALSREGDWGCFSETLTVWTAATPTVGLVAAGEKLLALMWERPPRDAAEERRAEFKLHSLRTEYQQEGAIEFAAEGLRSFCVDGLLAESDYLVSIRVQLESGVWGLWTEPKLFSTLPRPTFDVLECGEDYFLVSQPSCGLGVGQKVRSGKYHLWVRMHVQSGNIENNNHNNNSDNSGNEMGAEQEVRGVLKEIFSEVFDYREDNPTIRIGELKPGTTYEVRCAMWEENPLTGAGDWGEFSHPLHLRTLLPVMMKVMDLGERFALVRWHHDPQGSSSSPFSPSGDADENERVARIRDENGHFEVFVDCLDTHEKGILHKQVLRTEYILTNLSPATRYLVSVRSLSENGSWTSWRRLQLRTLAPIATTIHEIGEDFVRLSWQRIPSLPPVADTDERGKDAEVVSADVFISQYSVLVYSRDPLEGNAEVANQEMEEGEERAAVVAAPFEGGEADPKGHLATAYKEAEDAEIQRQRVLSSEFTAFRVVDLLPDREYVAVVRARSASGVWGMWSAPILFRTNPQFCIPPTSLEVGENYIHLAWGRDEHTVTLSDPSVQVGDLSVTAQVLRISGVNSSFTQEHNLTAMVRETTLRGLQPECAYAIQLRVCGSSGTWGLWGAAIHVLTRGTPAVEAVEVAEDYAVIAWRRRRLANPKGYELGRGAVTAYHLRVYNARDGVHLETFLTDTDSPYRVVGLTPDTYYCAELRAQYNNDAWGLWSVPLWCLTMRPMAVHAQLISERFCRLAVTRAQPPRRLPEDDGNPATEAKLLAFGGARAHVQLCLTTPPLTRPPYAAAPATAPCGDPTGALAGDGSLPAGAAGHRLVHREDVVEVGESVVVVVPGLRPDTVFAAAARSKLPSGDWGRWSETVWFATVPTTRVLISDIGENFAKVEWQRCEQHFPPSIADPAKVSLGVGAFTASRVRIRQIGCTTPGATTTYLIENMQTHMQLNGLLPATTYGVSVQTYNDNFDWGGWSAEVKLRTVPSVWINVQHVSEDALWVSWSRRTDLGAAPDTDTQLNVNIAARQYEVSIVGAEGYFRYEKAMSTNALFFRGLLPDTVYIIHVREQFTETGAWGLWSSRAFRTQTRMRVTFESTGEHFAMLQWRRFLPTPVPPKVERELRLPIMECEDIVQQFRLKVQRVGDSMPMIYDFAPTVSSYKLRNLLPSSEYRVQMSCKGFEGVWGFWNDEVRMRTLPKLQLSLEYIGEDYIRVSWKRGAWDGESAPDTDTPVWQVEDAISGYQVRVLDRNGSLVTSQTTAWNERSCTLSGLDLATLYSVEVCARDTYDQWGLWSDHVPFVTLHEVKVDLLQIGESFVQVEWGRGGSLEGLETYPPRAYPFHGSGLVKPFRSRVEAPAESGASPPEVLTVSISKSDPTEEYASEEEEQIAALEEDEDDKEAEEKEEKEESFLFDDELVTQWQIRIQCDSIDASLRRGEQFDYDHYDGAGVRTEDGATTNLRIQNLIPGATYLISVRGRQDEEEWGHWSAPLKVTAFPLLETQVESIGEDFISLSWQRPPYHEHTQELVCFPSVAEIHNYQVSIRPFMTERPFDERDEPLVEGARVYETTQPSQRLCNLIPGTRYAVSVREQVLGGDGKAIPGAWGDSSRVQFVHSIAPLRVRLVEIGEEYGLVEWQRQHLEADGAEEKGTAKKDAAAAEEEEDAVGGFTQFQNRIATGSISPALTTAVAEYELQVERLAEDAMRTYSGSLALDTTELLPGSDHTFHIAHLVHDSIYAVRVRARFAGGFFGLWSPTVKFVTHGRLALTVCSVYESSFYIAWRRPTPKWVKPPAGASNTNSNANVGKVGRFARLDHPLYSAICEYKSDMDSVAPSTELSSERDDEETPEALLDGLNTVVYENYRVRQYCLTVRGIGSAFKQDFTFSRDTRWACVGQLRPNTLYSASVCSLSDNHHMSMPSNRVSVLTLKPIEVIVRHFTENTAALHWRRSPSDVGAFAQLLEHEREKAVRACNEYERRELFELKRRLQDMEQSARERKADERVLAAYNARMEHNVRQREDTVHHLLPENIVLGRHESTGYHLQLCGEPGCAPFILNSEELGLRVRSASARRGGRPGSGVKWNLKRQLAEPDSRGSSFYRPSSVSCEAAAAAEGGGGDATRVQAVNVGGDPASVNASVSEDISAARRVLLDIQLRGSISGAVVQGLRPGSDFTISIRTRNERDEWQPWCVPATLHTLAPIELEQSRFGEHYISLFWHRLDAEVRLAAKRDRERYQELQHKYHSLMPIDLSAGVQRSDHSAEVYDELVNGLKEMQSLKQKLSLHKQSLCDGKLELLTDPQTPLKGYLLRLVEEHGVYTDYYLRNRPDEGDAAFTVTGLTPNHMYVCLLCPRYYDEEEEVSEKGDHHGEEEEEAEEEETEEAGFEVAPTLDCDAGKGLMWGAWTRPLKFMTQNLIQLQITYMGESFVDIEWQRMDHKPLSAIDADNTLTCDLLSNEVHVYQVSIEHENFETGERQTELRDMRACNAFCIDGLHPDTKYTIAVREWDAKGDWGLWCTPRTCTTQPGTFTVVHDVDENEALISWGQKSRQVDYNNDMHVLQSDVKITAFYLRVEEIPEGDDASTMVGSQHTTAAEAKTGADNAEPISNEPSLKGLFHNSVLSFSMDSSRQQDKDQKLMPAYLTEFDGVREDGLYYLLKRFDATTTEFKLSGIRPDRFYRIQVLSEAVERRFGIWSEANYLASMPQFRLTCDWIDEQYVEVSWERPPQRSHPYLSPDKVFVGEHISASYQLEASLSMSAPVKHPSSNGNSISIHPPPYHLLTDLPASQQTFRLSGLSLDTTYTSRVRSFDANGRASAWSEPLLVSTLAPLVVSPTSITESTMVVRWGRPEQGVPTNHLHPNNPSPPLVAAEGHNTIDNTTTANSNTDLHSHPCPNASPTPPVLGSRPHSENAYYLSVSRMVDGRMSTVLERKFDSETQSFEVGSLTPNTAYIFTVCAENSREERSLWSAERVIYTMKLIEALVAAVGEDFIRLEWRREAPDELRIGAVERRSSDPPPPSAARSSVASSEIEPSVPASPEDVGLSPLKAAARPARSFPLLDRPDERAVVYGSKHTRHVSFAVLVRRAEETEGAVHEVSSEAFHYTIPELRPDTVYFLSVRARYGAEAWGPWSEPVETGTYNLLALELRDLGENFFHVTWQRRSNTANLHALSLGKVEETMCYELVVHDFSQVAFGDEAAAPAATERALCTIFIPPKQRYYTVRELLTNHRYRICVRRWYQPSEGFLEDCPGVRPQTDDAQITEIIERTRAVPGVWSEPDYAVTLRAMICVANDISENSFRVHWERDSSVRPLPMRKNTAFKPVRNYEIRIDELVGDGSETEVGDGSYHVEEQLPPTESTFTATGLRPDGVYSVCVRCHIDKAWGDWSRTLYILTLPKLQVNLRFIREDGATVIWRREIRSLSFPDGAQAVVGDHHKSDSFELDVVSVRPGYQLTKKLKGSCSAHTLKRLAPNTLYAARVRSGEEGQDAWSLWSDSVYFATMMPLRLEVERPGEHFAHLRWTRVAQAAEQFLDHLPEEAHGELALGELDVLAYHLCVFNSNEVPSIAVIDKQLPREGACYQVHTLHPGTAYTAIVRSCSANGHWGLWSEECAFRTLDLVQLQLDYVGEAYAVLRWERPIGKSGAAPAEPTQYVLAIKSEANTLAEYNVLPQECAVEDGAGEAAFLYAVKALLPGTQYTAALQPYYGSLDGQLAPDRQPSRRLQTEWGLWSKTLSFGTLPPLKLRVEASANGLVQVHWSRAPPTVNPDALGTSDSSPKPSAGSTELPNSICASLPSCPPETSALGLSLGANAAGGGAGAAEFVSKLFRTATKFQLMVRRFGDAQPPDDPLDLTTMPSDIDSSRSGLKGSACGAGTRIPDSVDHLSEGMPLTTIPDMDENEAGSSHTHHVGLPDESGGARPSEPLWRYDQEFGLPAGGAGEAEMQAAIANLARDAVYVVRVRAMDLFKVWGPWCEGCVYCPPRAPTHVVLRKVNNQYCSLQWRPPRADPAPPTSREAGEGEGGGGGGGETDPAGADASGAVLHFPYRYVVEQACVSAAALRGVGGLRRSVSGAPRGAPPAAERGAIAWQVVDVVEDTVCAVRIPCPLSQLRCRVKCTRRELPPEAGGGGFGEPSEPVGLSVGTPPEPITHLTVSSLTNCGAVLEWNAPRKFTEGGARPAKPVFRVYLAAAGQSPVLVASVHRTAYVLSSLAPATPYIAQVVAENADGMSFRNPLIRFLTKPEEDGRVSYHDPAAPPLGTLLETTSFPHDDDDVGNGGEGGEGGGPLGAEAGERALTIPSPRELALRRPTRPRRSRSGSRRGRRKRRQGSARRRSKSNRAATEQTTSSSPAASTITPPASRGEAGAPAGRGFAAARKEKREVLSLPLLRNPRLG